MKKPQTFDDWEHLIVDDGSPDGTGELADAMAAQDPRVHVMHRQGKQGLGTAYLAGFGFAKERGYERVCEMDADFSHAPWDLPRLVYASSEAELVIGSEMSMTISSDHRIIDGAMAAAYLNTVKELLESPAALLV